MTEETAKVFCPYCGMLMIKYSNGCAINGRGF